MRPGLLCLTIAGGFTGAGTVSASAADPFMSAAELHFPPAYDITDLQNALHPGHPRLFAAEEGWQDVRDSLETSPHLQNALAALKEVAAEIQATPPEERVMTGRRLLSVSREVLRRTLALGVLYRLTDDEQYFERARAELLNAAEFEDWNPSHFLDTAEMTLAVAVGYDWLYHRLSEEEREVLRGAILQKGLQPGAGPHSWKQGDNNWNQVCFAGMVAGALAIADTHPDQAVQFLHETFAHNHLALEAYRPDGAYPEGPIYWSYGTHFQVVLLSVLQSALGQTWNLENYPAFQESAVYINVMIGPTGKFYNYADGRSSVPAMPALHWFAAQARDPALNARERNRLATAGPDLLARARSERLFALSLLWFDPTLERQEPSPLPLHWRAGGPNPVAVHRSSWAEDAFFAGMKGGSPAVNHGHMDIGSFVFDWRGKRWAVDLGLQSYESLESLGMRIWNRAQEADRWRVFRLNTHSHNTLVVDGQQQKVDGFAPILSFSGDPDDPFTVIEMTPVYQGSLKRAVRGMRLLGAETLFLHDEIHGLGAGQRLRWGMVTAAEVELRGSRATLAQEGEILHAQILSPAAVAFEIVQTNPPPNEFDAPNPGTRMLAFFIDGSDTPQQIRVVFSARPISEGQRRELESLPPPTRWESD